MSEQLIGHFKNQTGLQCFDLCMDKEKSMWKSFTNEIVLLLAIHGTACYIFPRIWNVCDNYLSEFRNIFNFLKYISFLPWPESNPRPCGAVIFSSEG